SSDLFKFIGSTEAEPLLNKKDSIKLLDAVKEQMAGKAEFRNRNIKVELVDELILVSELCDGYILIGTEWNFYSRFRLSSLLKKKRNRWKFIHQHVSMPDSKAQEGEAYGLEQIRTENIQLRDAVKRRTIELENKNRELEIEATLERVRARAMSMQHSDELGDLVATVFKELTALGFALTSSIIWIHDQHNATDTLWIASAKANKPAKPFRIQPFHNSFFSSITHAWKARDQKWTYTLKGQAKKTFEKAFFKELPDLPDALRKALINPKQVVFSASFNNFGALEIVETEALTDEKFDILHRFGKVFDLSYTRFNDLKKAEAQAREARIETALERIRARALSMHSSDELMEVAKVLREQLSLLGQPDLETSVVHLYEEDPDHILSWRAFRSGIEPRSEITYGYIIIPKNSCEFVQEWLTNYYSKSIEYTIEISGAKQEEWYDVLFKLAPDVINAMRQNKSIHEKRYHQFSKFSGGALLMVSRQRPSEESIYLQRRAAFVFDLAYRRFLDLKKAEAQAREAQIQLALERVRARTMAMQRSDELMETAVVLFDQLNQLGENIERTIIGVMNEEERVVDVGATRPDGSQMVKMQKFPIDEPILMQKVYGAWRQQKKSIIIDLQGED